ncbi:MAG: hypothetical protein ACKVZH_05270 [Blastocatellia bacterium]
MKKFTLICTTILLAALAFGNSTIPAFLMSWLNTPATTRAEISGKDGDLTVTQPNTIVNKYGKLAIDAPVGSAMIAVDNPGGPNGLDINTLAAGDLIMIVQMSGASVDSSNTINYGQVTNLNNAGRHEFVTVNKVQGNTITINPPCGGLRFNYTASGKVQVIRVPQYTSLTINSGASLTAPAWNGNTGGIVVVHVQNNAIINGTVEASGLGFRGGALSGAGGAGFRTDYVSPQQDFGAEKGESIVGFQADYDLQGGRYGRGAAANGGGGGTSHNSGGGGGANSSNGKAWTGQGVMDGSVVGAAAWASDPGYIANGNKLTDSSGGGRGGYSYAINNQDALQKGPGDCLWGGDCRREVGGLGGRSVNQDTTGRVFLGGGGGAGAQNNDAGGAGGLGGGMVYLMADTVSGNGLLKANGSNGGNTRNEHRDGAGGAGGGGTIVVSARVLNTGLNAQANGGNGGNQTAPVAPFDQDSEGPGGGGGGGYIAFSGGTMAAQVNGGAHGTSQASSVSEFPVNGATRGASGLIVNSVGAIPFCSTTSDLSITKTNNQTTMVPGAPSTYQIVVRNNGPNDVFGVPVTDTLPAIITSASWTCTASAGSACQTANGVGSISTKVDLKNGGTATFALTVTPSPSATGQITNTAAVGMPDGAVDPNPTNNTASDTDTLTPQADLSITKTDGSSTAVAGTPITYTIVVRNNGPSAANGATVTDNVPTKLTNVTWTCIPSAGAICGAANGSGNINTTVNLQPSATATFTLQATIINSATDTLTNIATVTSPASVPDPTPANNSATDIDTIVTTVDMAITKTNGVTTLVPGAQTAYTITVSNAGPSVVTGAAVADNLPATLTNATWTCTASAGSSCGSPNGTGSINTTVNLAVNGSATYTLTATVAANATGTLSNSASIAPPPGVVETNGANNAATDTDALASTDLAIVKTNSAAQVIPGQPTTYSIVVTNNGPIAATGATVTDVLPATLSSATWTCVASAGSSCGAAVGTGNINATVSLLVNGTATFSLTAQTSSTATGTLTNTATVATPSGMADPNQANNSSTVARFYEALHDMAITKTNNTNTLVPGTQTTYTIVVTNSGPSAAVGAHVKDIMPAGLVIGAWTCAASSGSSCGQASGTVNIDTTVSLLPGGTATYTVNATVASTATGTLTNTATVTAAAGTTDPNTANNSATDTDALAPTSDLSITKSNNTTVVTAGSQVTYTINVLNNGPSAVTGAAVVDTLPTKLTNATWACLASSGSSCEATSGAGSINTTVNLANGGNATFTITATVAADTLGTLTNTATVSAPSGSTDPSSGNNSASDTDNVISQANLRIAKNATPTQPIPGAPFNYTITVTNDGPSPVTGATVTDNVPAILTNVSWICVASSGSSCGQANGTGSINTTVNLASAGTATFTMTATLPADATAPVTNAASVTPPSGSTDPDSSNNQTSVTSTPVPNGDVAITKTANVTQIKAGDEVTYTITARNNGPSVATGVVVTDPLPNGVTLVSATSTQGTCSGTTTVTCNIGALAAIAPNNSAVVTIKIRVPFTFPVGPLSNLATVTSSTTDPTGNNNSNTSVVTVNPPPGAKFMQNDITIKAAGADVCIGGGNVLTVEVKSRNAGDGFQRDNPGPELLALLPVELNSIPGSCTATSGNCTLTSSQAEWNGEIAPGDTLTVTFQVRVRQNVTVGTRFCSTFRVNYDTNSDGMNDANTSVNFCQTANCPPVQCTPGVDCPDSTIGPGTPFPTDAAASDQRPGSLLIFPIYTSSASNPNQQNTRINLTNVHTLSPAYLHMFFVDGSNCSVADNFLCLTPNQTASFLISDLDPGVTGYIVVVSVDSKGCPTSFNYVIGSEFIKFASGHSAQLGAEAVAAKQIPSCPAASSTALINFDNVDYQRLGRVIAADGLPSRADGNDTIIVVDRIGGNLGIGAATLGSMFGIFYDDAENALSFTFTAQCQLMSSLNNSFPRTTPRYETFIPAGRTGWLKLSLGGTSTSGAIVGAVLNTTTSQSGFRGGRNFHKLTLSETASLTIPVFPPSCQ